MNKDFQLYKGLWRIQYWCTVIPLVMILLYTYSEYKDQEALVVKSQKIFNRQIQLTAISQQKRIERLKKEYDDKIGKRGEQTSTLENEAPR